MTRLLLALALVLASGPAVAQTYVSSALGEESGGAGGTTVATSAISVGSGAHLVAFIQWTATTSGDPTLSGTGGDSFTQGVCEVSLNGAGGAWLKYWYREAPTPSGSYVVTATWPDDVDFKKIWVIQHTGVASSGSYDTCANDGGSGSVTPTCTTGTFTTTTANQVLIAGAYQHNNDFAWSAGGSATLRITDAADRIAGQTQNVSSVQTNATASMVSAGSGDACNIIVATFKAAAASGRRPTHRIFWGLP